MDYQDLEKKAKEALGTLSLYDQLDPWEEHHYSLKTPKTVPVRTNKTSQTARPVLQEKIYRIKTMKRNRS